MIQDANKSPKAVAMTFPWPWVDASKSQQLPDGLTQCWVPDGAKEGGPLAFAMAGGAGQDPQTSTAP